MTTNEKSEDGHPGTIYQIATDYTQNETREFCYRKLAEYKRQETQKMRGKTQYIL